MTVQALCLCGLYAIGTFAELLSAGWVWNIAAHLWLCPACQPREPSPPHEQL